MSTADDADDEKTLSGPVTPASARAGMRDAETGLQAERRRGRAGEPQRGHTLPLGTRLRDYEITGLIGEGGFGIVYLAWDHSLQRKIAIKEYMPASMAARVSGSSAIVVKSERHLDTFRAGLKSFVNEARLLARFDHPSLVKVYRFWEENGTAYMVMPYYEGPTLKAALAELGRAPSEAELRAWLKPLLDALAVMHAAQCYHRDIAPDNILLTPRGPLLLDFGAARRVIGDMTHAITVVLKPGYAPIEQYGDVATMTQGAWTDLYALACVVYYAIAGRTPTSSVERLMDDRLVPLAVSAAGRYGDAFLRAIDAALAVRPGDRPQSEREFRALLDAGLPPQPDDARDSGRGPFATSSLAPSGWSEPSAWNELATPADLPTSAAPPASTPLPASIRPPSPATVGASRNPAATLLIGVAVVAVIATVALFAWLQQRGPSRVEAGTGAAAIAPPAAASFAAPSLPTRAPSAPTGALAVESPAVLGTAPAPPAVTDAPVLASPASRAAPVVVERAPVDAPSAVEAKVDRPADATPAAPAAAPVARATIEGEAASGVATASPRPARARRESAPPVRADDTAAPKPAAPRPPMVGARCSDILQKASLEPLTAAEAEYLKRECR